MKMTKTILDVNMEATLSTPSVEMKVWLKKFDMKTMTTKVVFEVVKGVKKAPESYDELGDTSKLKKQAKTRYDKGNGQVRFQREAYPHSLDTAISAASKNLQHLGISQKHHQVPQRDLDTAITVADESLHSLHSDVPDIGYAENSMRKRNGRSLLRQEDDQFSYLRMGDDTLDKLSGRQRVPRKLQLEPESHKGYQASHDLDTAISIAGASVHSLHKEVRSTENDDARRGRTVLKQLASRKSSFHKAIAGAQTTLKTLKQTAAEFGDTGADQKDPNGSASGEKEEDGYGYGFDPVPIENAITAARSGIVSALKGYLLPLNLCTGKQEQPPFVTKDKAQIRSREAETRSQEALYSLGEAEEEDDDGDELVGIDKDGYRLAGFGERTFRESVFTTEFKFGVPKISAMVSSIQLAGVFGVRYGLAVDESTLMSAMATVEPIANLVLKFDSLGEAGAFVGGIVTKMKFIDARIPIQGTMKPIDDEFGFNFGWEATALKARIDGFQRGPGTMCPGDWTKNGNCIGNTKGRYKKFCVGKGETANNPSTISTRSAAAELGEGRPEGGAAGPAMKKLTEDSKANFRAVGSADIKEAMNRVTDDEKEAERAAIADAELATRPKPVSCATSPCNIWWVPKGSGCPAAAPCSHEVGCDFLTGKARPAPMYDWSGFSEKADLMGWDPACYAR